MGVWYIAYKLGLPKKKVQSFWKTCIPIVVDRLRYSRREIASQRRGWLKSSQGRNDQLACFVGAHNEAAPPDTSISQPAWSTNAIFHTNYGLRPPDPCYLSRCFR